MAIAIVAVSVFLRVIYFLQLNATPLIALERIGQLDTNYFHTWGLAIARGDWRSATVCVPMHPWHRDVADAYLADHPEERAALASTAPPGSTPEAALWTRWLGGHQFYQDPLYAYLVGLTYKAFGPDPRGVFVWQMMLGVLGNLLIWSLARRFFGDAVAAAAAGLAVFAAPLMFLELLLLRDSTIVVAGLGLTWLLTRAFDRGTWQVFLTFGAALGAAMMLKSTFALYGVAFGVALAARSAGRWHRAWLPAGAVVAGALMALAPLAARNLSLGVPPLALSSSGALVFSFSNQVDYPEEVGFYVDVPELGRVMGAANGHATAAVLETLRAHTPGSLAALLWKKFDRTWHWYEIPNNDNFYYTRLFAPVLSWLPITAWLITPLGLLGLGLGARRFTAIWPLYLLVGCTLAPLLIFYVLGRFRAPLLATLLPFAALALVEIAGWLRRRRFVPALAAAGLVTVTIAGWTGRPLPDHQPLIRPTDWLLPYLAEYQGEIERADEAHDRAAAVAAYLQYFKYEPDADQLLTMGTPDLFRSLASLHRRCGAALHELGRDPEAYAEMARADALLQFDSH